MKKVGLSTFEEVLWNMYVTALSCFKQIFVLLEWVLWDVKVIFKRVLTLSLEKDLAILNNSSYVACDTLFHLFHSWYLRIDFCDAAFLITSILTNMFFVWCRKLSAQVNNFYENQMTLFQLPVSFEKILAYLSWSGQWTLGILGFYI